MEASKEIVTQEERTLVTKQDVDDWLFGSDTKLTEKQKALFYQVCLTSQLNPVKREVHAVAFGNNFNIITGYEVYLKRAERTGRLDYWKATVEKRDNEWVGICTVKRTDRTEPTTIEAWFNEYNQGNKMWKEKPRTMIRKVAIAQAFRMSFPDDLGGLPYTSDEITIDGEIVPPPKEISKPEKPKLKTPKPDPLKDRIAKCIQAWEPLGYSLEELESLAEIPVEEWTTETLTWLGAEWKKEKARQES